MSRNRQKPKKFRGPSRPVDPRYLPGVPKRKGPDPFALGLIGVSTAFVLIIILFVAFSQNSAGTTASNSGGTSGQVTNPPVGSSPVAGATMTAMEVDFLTKTVGLPRISDADAKALLDSGKATFIDVRNPDFKNPDPARAKPYDAGHIKGAIYIPTDALMTSLSKVPKDRPVILYCEWPGDEESASSAYKLIQQGYTNIQVLQGPMAYSKWVAAGYPTEVSATAVPAGTTAPSGTAAPANK